MNKTPSRRGEQAARTLCLRNLDSDIEFSIALPGEPGQKVDWEDVLLNNGVDAVRSGILGAVPFKPTDEELAAPSRTTRPIINVMPGRFDQVVRQSAEALAASGEVFQRGNILVSPGRLAEPVARDDVDGIGRPKDALVIITHRPEAIRLALARHARFMKPIGEGEFKPVDPPMDIAKTIHSSESAWGDIPELVATSETPMITPSNRIIDKPGLDRQSGLYFDPGKTVFPAIKMHPSKQGAEQALDTLSTPISQFPFVDDAARSTMLAAILTLFCRPFLRAAPMFIMTAPKMGSGKSLLATILGYIATGRAPAMMSHAKDEESERKRVLSLLMQGSPVSVIDNISRTMASDTMCSVLSEPLFQDRLLGFSKVVEAPTTTIWCATGNNLEVAGDLTTRCLVIKIDPAVEKPEERSFDIDLHEWVPVHRTELAAAALTIMKAYHVAGRPMAGKLPVFGRFEMFSRMVREPLVWLGLDDPIKTKELLETRDPNREIIHNMLVAWDAAVSNEPQTAGAMLQLAKDRAWPNQPNVSQDTELLDAIKEAVPHVKEPTSRHLGKWLASHEGRIEGAMRFERVGIKDHAARWRVAILSSPTVDKQSEKATDGQKSAELEEFQELLSSHSEGEEKSSHIRGAYIDGADKTPETPLTPETPGWEGVEL